jgi:DNA invertase Pin-like site-specific DNA recombinase
MVMQEVPGLPNREARMSRTKNCDSGGQPDALTYSRVSTHEQADKGTSLKTQTAENLVKAQHLGWRVLPEHVIEEDCSGKDLGRDGIRQILEIAASEKPHGVVIHTLDRLYRPENNGDEWRVFELLHRLEALGLEVVWVDETIPSEGEFSSVFMFLDSWRSGRERRQMVERSVRGKREKARRGKVVNPHSLPKWLRYDRSREQVELDEEWAQVGRLLFHLVGEEGLTLSPNPPKV